MVRLSLPDSCGCSPQKNPPQGCVSHLQIHALLSSNGAPLTRLMEVVLLKKSSLRLHLLRSDSCVCSPQVVRLPPQDSYGCSPQMVRLSPLYLLNRRVNGWWIKKWSHMCVSKQHLLTALKKTSQSQGEWIDPFLLSFFFSRSLCFSFYVLKVLAFQKNPPYSPIL